jgi:hypothetical protein
LSLCPARPDDLFTSLPIGYAYQTGEYFVHFYGERSGTWRIHSEFTASEKAKGSIDDWITYWFGAKDIKGMQHEVGSVVAGVWRPGLFSQTHRFQALETTRPEQRAAEQALYLLVERLNDLFLYVEPNAGGLDSYGPKTRELLILACTEVENLWSDYIRRARGAVKKSYTTKDYVRLLSPLHLAEYQIRLTPYPSVEALRPFNAWTTTQPTQSLEWYDAYNKAKHDRTTNLHLATLSRCIQAVSASIVLFCVRYGPFPLYDDATPVSILIRHLFDVELIGCDPTTFYVPLVDFRDERMYGMCCAEASDYVTTWKVERLTV